MSILFLLIPLAVVIMIVAAAFFIWSVRSGQYDDLEGPAHRILMDDDDPMIPEYRPKSRSKSKSESPDGPAQSAAEAQDRDGSDHS